MRHSPSTLNRGRVTAAAAFAAAVVALAFATSAQAQTFFVAPNGSDANPGTRALPFATIERAQQEVRQHTAAMTTNVTVQLREGTYALDEPLAFSEELGDSGRNGHKVVYKAYRYGTAAQEDVTISGGIPISGWVREAPGSDVWRTEVGDLETRQLYVNGRRATRTALGTGLPGNVTVTETGYETDSTAPQAWSNPEDIELAFHSEEAWYSLFNEPRCGVASITGDSSGSVITMDQPCFRRAKSFFRVELFPGFFTELAPVGHVENSKSFLTEAGSFYLDRAGTAHVLYYKAREGEDMTTADAVAPVLETLVEGGGTEGAPLHDITFKGLRFAHSTWLKPNEDTGFIHFYATFYEAGEPAGGYYEFGDKQDVPGNVTFSNTEELVFEGNRFEHLGAVALELRNSASNVVRGNVIADISQGGLAVHGGDSNRITDNWVHDVGVELRGGAGMFIYETSNSRVQHNQVNGTGYTGIIGLGEYTSEVNQGARIRRNLIFDTLRGTQDGGGIYLAGRQGASQESGALVKGNVVHDIPGIGIYTDVGANWVTSKLNLVYGSPYVFGGSSEPGAAVENVIITRNFSDHEETIWPNVEDPPVLQNHTVLGTTDPVAACEQIAECDDTLDRAGLRPEWESLLD